MLRWIHIFFGVIWIGHLYYFNFVQGAFFAEVDAGVKSVAIQKLVPRALWWFRWGAMWTIVTGLLMYGLLGHQLGSSFMVSSRGIFITMGIILGLVMWANVWFRIWPCQKMVLRSATPVATGGQAIPEAAARAASAGLASRHNVFFLHSNVVFYGSSEPLGCCCESDSEHLRLLLGIFLVATAVFEYNAIKGKLGPLTTVKGVVHAGFAFALVLYVLAELL